MGGFPYLGGLPESLASVPRLQTPRQKVPAGTVGIAAGQVRLLVVVRDEWVYFGDEAARYVYGD